MRVRWGKDIKSDGDNVWGAYVETNGGGSILLDSSMLKARLAATFFHEVCHALDKTYSLGLSHKQIYGLGEGLAQALVKLL